MNAGAVQKWLRFFESAPSQRNFEMGSSLRVPKWNRAGDALRRDGEYKASAASEDELGRKLYDARIAAVG